MVGDVSVHVTEPRVTTARQVSALSAQQMMFIQGLLKGKTQRQAYREAYPNDRSTDRNIAVTANRLLHSPKIQTFIQGVTDTAEEKILEDKVQTRRFVFRELFALSKQAKQERHQIKALELIGKSCGVFEPKVMDNVDNPSKATLKHALTERMWLINEV
jgi:hypothetical protein